MTSLESALIACIRLRPHLIFVESDVPARRLLEVCAPHVRRLSRASDRRGVNGGGCYPALDGGALGI
jgi:hypothetical protein